MTTAPRCRYNLDQRCPSENVLDRLAAAEVAARGYRERAERAEETMLLAVRRADRLADQIDRMRQDAEDDRDDAAHAARPVAPCEPRSPGDALGDTPAPDRAAAGIVSAAHYCRCATLGLVCGHSGRMGA